jgi:hypothetical protein
MQRSPSLVTAALAALAACGSGTPSGTSLDASLEPPVNGFQVMSPEVTILPGQEVTYCYYFRTPNQDNLVIKRWASAMTPGSHHMIMYTTATDAAAPGTLSTKECGGFTGGNVPSWTYAAQMPTAEVALPADDGNGLPLGQEIAPNTPAYFQMHYLNASDAPIQARVTLNAEAYAPGTRFTKTAAYVTYNSLINVPPGAIDDLETMTCEVPPNTKFWMVSTHSHKQSMKTVIKDGTSASTKTVFSSTSWEHPGATVWNTMPYYAFATNKLTYECTYNNTGDNQTRTVTAGPSAALNEMCMATGYYFPATKPLLCLNNLGPF